MVTKRFILIVSSGILILAASIFFGMFSMIFVLFNTICFGLLAIDYLVSPKDTDFVVCRPVDDKLYFKTENTIQINVRSKVQRGIKMEIKDDVPGRFFTTTQKCESKIVLPNEETEFCYKLVPSKRGSYLFSNVYVRYTGYLGLIVKYAHYSVPIDFKVYPNLRDMSKYRLITNKNRVLSVGERRISMFDTTTEFESLREYVEGDDYRKINWIATARERKPMVNQYEAEKNQPVYIMLDTGRPMGYSIKGYKKLDYAVNAALILADIVNQNGDLSGLMVFDTKVKTILPPGKGQAHRKDMMECLYHVEDSKNTSDYEGAFLTFSSKQKRRSLVFIFTDFENMEQARELTDYVAIIKRRHIPIIILMKNISLIKLTTNTDKNIKDAYRKGIAYEFLDERRKIIKALNANGIFCIESFAEDFTISAVNNYILRKRQSI